MLDFGPIRRRLIAIAIMIVLITCYFWLYPAAQQVESGGPEFIVRESSADGTSYPPFKIYHLKSQTCWLYFRYGKGDTIQVPKEVCQ